MLIVLAGGIGAGKTTIALKVSHTLGIPFHSIDDDKKEIGKEYPEFQKWVTNGIPFPDEFRKKTFDLTLKKLRELSNGYRNIIVEETFHRKALREPFFDEAGKILGGMLLTLVEVDEEVVKERLEKRQNEEADHIANYEMYLSFKSKSDDIENADYILKNNEDFEKNFTTFVHFLEKNLKLKREN